MTIVEDDSNVYDEVEIEDLDFDEELGLYTFPCPCGDQFEITLSDLRIGKKIAVCPSCSLQIRVIFEKDDLPPEEELNHDRNDDMDDVD